MLDSLITLGPVRFDEGPQHSDFLLDVCLKIEPILLCEPQLAVVVVEGFLGDAHHLGGLLKVDFVFVLVEGVMNLSPLFHVF